MAVEGNLSAARNRRYELKERLRPIMNGLRDLEDYCRLDLDDALLADRVRGIHESLTDDVIEGVSYRSPDRWRAKLWDRYCLLRCRDPNGGAGTRSRFLRSLSGRRGAMQSDRTPSVAMDPDDVQPGECHNCGYSAGVCECERPDIESDPVAGISRESAMALIEDAHRWERAYRRLADALQAIRDTAVNDRDAVNAATRMADIAETALFTTPDDTRPGR